MRKATQSAVRHSVRGLIGEGGGAIGQRGAVARMAGNVLILLIINYFTDYIANAATHFNVAFKVSKGKEIVRVRIEENIMS